MLHYLGFPNYGDEVIRLGDKTQLWRKEDTLEVLERIRDAMHFRRVNKSDLAHLVGVRQSTVSQWFTKERLPDTEVFLLLQRVLGGDGNWWFGLGGTGPPREQLPVPPRERITQTKRVAKAASKARTLTPKKRVGRKDG